MAHKGSKTRIIRRQTSALERLIEHTKSHEKNSQLEKHLNEIEILKTNLQ